jgi:hypothetical protein
VDSSEQISLGAFRGNGPLDIKVKRFFVCFYSEFERKGGVLAKFLTFTRPKEFEPPWVETAEFKKFLA